MPVILFDRPSIAVHGMNTTLLHNLHDADICHCRQTESLLQQLAARPDALVILSAWRLRRLLDEDATDSPPPALSQRQWEVLERVAMGDANKEIGRTLNISVATVKAHLEALYLRLGVKNRTQAALLFRQWQGSGSTRS